MVTFNTHASQNFISKDMTVGLFMMQSNMHCKKIKKEKTCIDTCKLEKDNCSIKKLLYQEMQNQKDSFACNF